MHSPDVGLPRAARATALVSLVVCVSVVSHALGGGHAPATGILVALAVLLLPFALVLTGRRLSTARAVTGLGLGQVVAHLTLGVLDGHPAGHGAMCVPVTSGHLHHAGMQCTTVLASAGAATSTHLAPSAGMLLAHLLATVALTGVVLRGEAVLHRVLALLLPCLVRLLQRPALHPRLATVAPAPLRSWLGWAPRSGRGPPVLLAS